MMKSWFFNIYRAIRYQLSGNYQKKKKKLDKIRVYADSKWGDGWLTPNDRNIFSHG